METSTKLCKAKAVLDEMERHMDFIVANPEDFGVREIAFVSNAIVALKEALEA